jgi:phage-related protein
MGGGSVAPERRAHANPIGIVVVAIAALAAGIVIAYRHSETFRDAIAKAWAILKLSPLGIIIGEMQALAGAVESVVGWISRIHWPSPPSWLGKIGGVVGGLFGAAPPSAPAIMARGLATPRSSGRPRGSGPSSAGPPAAV